MLFLQAVVLRNRVNVPFPTVRISCEGRRGGSEQPRVDAAWGTSKRWSSGVVGVASARLASSCAALPADGPAAQLKQFAEDRAARLQMQLLPFLGAAQSLPPQVALQSSVESRVGSG